MMMMMKTQLGSYQTRGRHLRCRQSEKRERVHPDHDDEEEEEDDY